MLTRSWTLPEIFSGRKYWKLILKVSIFLSDEVHFLFQCPSYSIIWNKFYYKVKTLIPNITQLPINGLINKVMNSSNYFINMS